MHALPEALAPMAAYPQFIVYTLAPHETKPGKLHKFPVDFRSGRVASAHDSAIWTTAEHAIACAAHYNQHGGGQQFGVGFVFSENDPFFFIDVDGAYQNGAWSDLANGLVAAFPGAAVEVSTSGTGLHIFGTATNVPPHKVKHTGYGLEFYTSGRFVALTGTHAQGNAAGDYTLQVQQLVHQFFARDDVAAGAQVDWTDGPVPEWRGPTDDEQLLTRALRSSSAANAFGGKASFADLFNRNVEALARTYPPDPGSTEPYGGSEADSALASHLAFWTGKDCERIRRLMLRSSLVREKWEREDYLPRTILAVCQRAGDVLVDKEAEPLNLPHLPPAGGERRAVPRPTPTEGSTFVTIEDQIKMFEGCVYVVDQHSVLIPGGVMLKPDQFRAVFGGYSFPMDNANERTSRDAWEAFTQSQAFRKPTADGTCFKPNRAPAEIINDGGRLLVNTWWPVEVPSMPGDVTPFLQHLAKLLPNERDQRILLAYMAACVQHVGYKFQWAPIIQGVEGNGKTLLTRCVAHAVGRRYVHWPKASKLSNQFNGWMLKNVFYAVEDIYLPGAKREIAEDLKPMITGGDGLEIEGKGKDQFSADVCGNFMFNTNHKDALPKTRNDRRYAIFYTAQQEAAHLARDGMVGNYMSDLYDWLKGDGYAMVTHFLSTYPIPDDLNPAGKCQRAPETSSTDEAIGASLGSIEQEVLEAIHQGQQGFQGDWISSTYFTQLLEQKKKHLSLNKYAKTLAALGYVPHPGLVDGRVNNMVAPEMKKSRLYVRTGSPAFYLQGPAVIANAYSAANGGAQIPMQHAA